MANEGLIFPKLSERQKDLYLKVITNLQTYGYFDRSSGSNGVQYIDATNNPFKDQGQECYHCVFYYLEGNAPRCELIEGAIEPEAWCKFWIISEQDIKDESKAAFTILNRKNNVFEIKYNIENKKTN